MKKFHIISCHVLWRELCYYSSISKNSFTYHFLQQGLHNTPDILRTELQQAIDKITGDYTAILLGYGLCSNGLVDIVARDIPLVVMRGHDCITFLLGSKERYQNYFNQNPGTYWYSPGWIDTSLMPGQERYNKYIAEYIEKYGPDNAAYLMEVEQNWIKNYSRATYVDLDFYDTTQYKAFTRDCAAWLGWNYDELTGESSLIQNFVDGNWDSKDFLIVQPGEKIAASFDESIVKSQDEKFVQRD